MRGWWFLACVLVLAASAGAQLVAPKNPNMAYVEYRFWVGSVPSYVVMWSAGNQSYNVYIFTEDQYQIWQSKPAQAAYYGTLQPGELKAVPLNQTGGYRLVIEAGRGRSPQVGFRVFEKGLTTGVVSYPRGEVRTRWVMGYFNISDINTRSGSWAVFLGLPVEVRLVNGTAVHYWAVVWISKSDWEEGAEVYYYSSRDSTPYYGGYGYQYFPSADYQVYRSEDADFDKVVSFRSPKMPLAGYFVGAVGVDRGVVWINFTMVFIRSGGYIPPTVKKYSVKVFPPAPAQSADIVATARYLSRSGGPLLVELGIGEVGKYYVTTFYSLKAEMALVFWDGSAWRPFPDLYSFGVNTGGWPTNVVVSYRGGYAYLNASAGLKPQRLVNSPPPPRLYLTYVAYSNPLTGSSYGVYITAPVTIRENQTLVNASDGRYVLAGYLVNGNFTREPPTLKPSDRWFTTYVVEPKYVLISPTPTTSPSPTSTATSPQWPTSTQSTQPPTQTSVATTTQATPTSTPQPTSPTSSVYPPPPTSQIFDSMLIVFAIIAILVIVIVVVIIAWRRRSGGGGASVVLVKTATVGGDLGKGLKELRSGVLELIFTALLGSVFMWFASMLTGVLAIVSTWRGLSALKEYVGSITLGKLGIILLASTFMLGGVSTVMAIPYVIGGPLFGVQIYRIGKFFNNSLIKVGGILTAIPLAILALIPAAGVIGPILIYIGLGKIQKNLGLSK
ncbi:thermopsin family protease [Pyrobaculum neutrophilum]|uniref:Uncharacterized protein n=1 Tax=Pyrobaculum neutrophilum (strain DSM 2338 / JCM 9278 / NBRC 100436 / V24Sta) TaxID=444157 RepID=B1YBU7_PYRNV|nr:thermopsin family protease [Pyrobaculum neutrophilum]ACB39331.1 hypothetical protein Tneu_0383 [Pyrobaculum neutrophilum V24Sta]